MGEKEAFNEFPVIETERLKLRSMTSKDSQNVFGILSSEIVTKYYGIYPMKDISEAEILIEKFDQSFNAGNAIRWGIELKKFNKIIGTCGYHNWSKRHFRAEIGYEVNSSFWGNGYAKEAISSIIHYGFNKMNLERIEAVVYPENKASENMLKKMNFVYEGYLRKYVYFRDKHQDLNMFSLIK
ncbi:putative ribosomal N-acetyltransferase YdaF [Clostridium puniceum]|uniref:Putative ribosomal N-acetyltransferase YdaF n=1 Tax=Clostridium puniceum TaxID=29367 RepID=A0A1S8TGN4_9CLOT|nr:GNAT family N-acetyltransferase [Clostridium puniceum]OOM76967.1 putative ribosomal N-acetyltransferase YdaF [Clostridium puniceum]